MAKNRKNLPKKLGLFNDRKVYHLDPDIKLRLGGNDVHIFKQRNASGSTLYLYINNYKVLELMDYPHIGIVGQFYKANPFDGIANNQEFPSLTKWKSENQ